jgi:hypothetical protein
MPERVGRSILTPSFLKILGDHVLDRPRTERLFEFGHKHVVVGNGRTDHEPALERLTSFVVQRDSALFSALAVDVDGPRRPFPTDASR